MKDKYFRVAKDISRWKIHSPIERLLARKADNNYFWKKLYVQYYKLFDRKYYDKGCEFIKNEIERQRPNFENFSNLSDEWLKIDMIYSLHRFGVSFEEYFLFRFPELSCFGRAKFNNLKLQYGYCEQFNGQYVRNICEDKIKTFEYLKKYFKRAAVLIRNEEDDMSIFTNNLHPSNLHPSDLNLGTGGKRLVFKPLRGHSGQGIKFLNFAHLNDSFKKRMLNQYGPFILEEYIEQSPDIAQLHPESINTIRIATFRNKDEVNVFGAAIRMGRGESAVDNAGSGGIYAGIDIETGIIVTKACDNRCNRFVKHPESGVVIPGFTIPRWQELKTIINQVAREIEGATLIAWDFALSNNGWCLVEANDVGESYLLQVPEMIGIKPRLYSLFDKLER